MSTPICSRCQKIYTAGSAPAKCINCGGDVKVPGAKPVATPTKTSPVKPVSSSNTTPGKTTPPPNFRGCSKTGCLKEAYYSYKFFPSQKDIVWTPLTPVIDRDALDYCQQHSDGFVVTQGWKLVKRAAMPTFIDYAREQHRTHTTTTTSEGSGCFDVFAAIFGFIILAAIVIGAGWLVIEFFSWLSSGTGGGGGGGSDNNMPFRMPRWRRR